MVEEYIDGIHIVKEYDSGHVVRQKPPIPPASLGLIPAAELSLRLTHDQRVAFRTSTDPGVAAAYDALSVAVAGGIMLDPEAPDVVAGFAAAVSAGLLTEEEKAEILKI